MFCVKNVKTNVIHVASKNDFGFPETLCGLGIEGSHYKRWTEDPDMGVICGNCSRSMRMTESTSPIHKKEDVKLKGITLKRKGVTLNIELEGCDVTVSKADFEAFTGSKIA